MLCEMLQLSENLPNKKNNVILIIEQDKRPQQGRRFTWQPRLFAGPWGSRRTWRVYWGFWSLSYYPEPGLRDFFRHIEAGNTTWIEPRIEPGAKDA